MYELIEHKKLDSAAASITFSGIPQNYTDLYLTLSSRYVSSGSDESDNIFIQVNSITSGYSARNLVGLGTSSASYSNPNNITSKVFVGSSASTLASGSPWSSTSVYMPNFSGGSNKSFSSESVQEANSGSNYKTAVSISAGLLSNSEAINSLTITHAGGTNFAQYSSATLYGVNRTSGRGRPKAVGGNITYANGYWVHTFTGSGTFYVNEPISVEALVIAGGGGGGRSASTSGAGGGGGAGGYRSSVVGELSGGGASAERIFTAAAGSAYAVTVGAGGSGAGEITAPTSGSDSMFGPITSIGGGAGGSWTAAAGMIMAKSGGSGGGAPQGDPYSSGSGTTAQGYAGGTKGLTRGAAGGGGAGGLGESHTGDGYTTGASYGRAGGLPLYSTITGSSVGRAGGGGSGAHYSNTFSIVSGGGGRGGYGISSPLVNPLPGDANTGGGGGGGAANTNSNYMGITGGAGGSGVVIIRYPAHEVQTVTYAEGVNQYRIDPATIQGAWTFETSEDSTYGGHTTTDYASVGSIQSTNRKWPQYAGALQTNKVDSNNAGMRISSATNWTMSNEQTVEMWVKPFSGGTLGRLFIWGNRNDNACTMIDRDTSTGQLLLRTNTGLASTTGYTPYDEWSWVVVSKRGSEIRLFVNGIQVYQNSNGDGGGYTSDGRYFTIGADWDSGYVDAPRYSGGAYWQDIVAYNTAPFHSMSSIPVPTVPLTARIG